MYSLKLLYLSFVSEKMQLSWLETELQIAERSSPVQRTRRRLLHCTDLPLPLKARASREHVEKLADYQRRALKAYDELNNKMGIV